MPTQHPSLRRTKTLATALLGLMALLFVVCLSLQARYPALEWLAAFAEAAMVGALADWFAVSALFRHPLGLPIPHTAIIPNNKNRIGASLAQFIEQNFLTAPVIGAEMQRINFSALALRWLSKDGNQRWLANHAAHRMPALLALPNEQAVVRWLQQKIESQLDGGGLSPLAASLLAGLQSSGQQQRLFEQLIDWLSAAVDANQILIRNKIHELSPRWIPKSIDDKFFIGLIEQLQWWLASMKQADSPSRQLFDARLNLLRQQLAESDQHEMQLASTMRQLAAQPQLAAVLHSAWQGLKQSLQNDLEQAQPQSVELLVKLIAQLVEHAQADSALLQRLNQAAAHSATAAIVGRRRLIADLGRRVIEQWDGRTVAQQVESYIGRDLQFIRINGTLVGGLIGVALHALALVLR